MPDKTRREKFMEERKVKTKAKYTEAPGDADLDKIRILPEEVVKKTMPEIYDLINSKPAMKRLLKKLADS